MNGNEPVTIALTACSIVNPVNSTPRVTMYESGFPHLPFNHVRIE
uniref:Uncharacterized protein n=1 Tax=Salmonella phage vB_SE130_2P TaxID=3236707 RepID=A0AB39C429_9VIRU